jgi:DNA-binding protein Fis
LANAAFASRIDWTRIHVCWGDERCVPPDDARSNFRLARERLLDLVRIPPSQVHRMAGELPAESGARGPETLEQAVERHLKAFVAAHKDGLPVRDLYDRVLAEVERPLLRLVLGATRGNQIKAAAMLGLNRNTLRKKIRELDLPVVRGLG